MTLNALAHYASRLLVAVALTLAATFGAQLVSQPAAAQTATVTVTSVTPSNGPPSQLVNVLGSGFQSGATVLFGGVASISVAMLAPSNLSVRVPSGPSGMVTVTVINPGGSTGSLPSAYDYGGGTGTSSFSAVSVSPNNGPTTGGTSVTITGNGFVSGGNVLIGSALATNVSVLSTNQLVALTPPGVAGSVAVTVSDGLGNSATLPAAFTYTTSSTTTPPPAQGNALTVAGVTPNVGLASGGTVVTVTGSGFAAGASVLFGLQPGTNVIVTSSSQLTVTTPANSVATGPVNVTVVNPGGVSGALSAAFTYGASASGALTIGSVSPTSGSLNGGTTVTINGTGLTSVTSVQFGGTAGTGLTVGSGTMLTVVAPPHAVGPVLVTIVAGSGSSTSLPNGYVYNSAPTVTVTSVTPAASPLAGGGTVTLAGTGFANGMTVAFGGTLGTSVSVVSSTQATVTVPSRSSAGGVDIVVGLTTGQNATLPSGFNYQATGSVSAQLPAQGFGLFVFSGGINAQMVSAAGCTGSSSAFWATDSAGQFVVYVPNTSVTAVNAGWNTRFPTGIPASTPLIGKCS